MGVKLVSASGGSVELVAPATATNYTATMPANTGTVITTASTFAGTGPAFSAYAVSTTALSSATWNVVTLDGKTFDTNNNFASNKFTPTVAGYYQLSANATVSAGTSAECALAIYKNNSQAIVGADLTASTIFTLTVSGLVYMNGTTDFVDIRFYIGTTGKNTQAGANNTSFSGFLARAA